MGWELRDIPHWWHLWQVPSGVQRSSAPGQREMQPRIIKSMRNTEPAGEWYGLDLSHRSASRSCPICSRSNTPSAPSNTLQCSQYPPQSLAVTFPSTSRGVNALPLLRVGQDELGVPGVPAGSHSQADPGAPGPGTGTVPLAAGFKGEGRELHPSPKVFLPARCSASNSWERV